MGVMALSCVCLRVVAMVVFLSALRRSEWASCCYVLSALLPSRVELQEQEIAALQLLGSGFLLQLQEQLQDYRRHFEPQALSVALALYISLVQRLLLVPSVQQKQHQQRHDWKKGNGISFSEMGPGFLGISTAAFNEWLRRTRDSLQISVDSGFEFVGGQQNVEEGGSACLKAADGDTSEDNVWVWGLPKVLRGPSGLHDMLRCFIYRSLSAAAGRLLGQPVAALLQLARGEDNRRGSLEETTETQQRALTSSKSDEEAEIETDTETETETDRVLCSLAQGIRNLYTHVQSELLLYAPVFAPLLPLQGEQPLLVLAAAKAVLLSVLPLVSRCADQAAADPERKGMPAKGGQELLAALSAFDRLADEVSCRAKRKPKTLNLKPSRRVGGFGQH